MHIVMLGLGHATAPVTVREKTSFGGSSLAHGLSKLMAQPGIYEAVILSTCNRTEIYAVAEEVEAGEASLKRFLMAEKNLSEAMFETYFRFYPEEDAIRHLLRVAAGLESQILGESQILKQVKDAHAAAQLHRTTGSMMDTLFRFALMAGKRARTETEISRGAVSTSSAAIELAEETLGSLAGRAALIMGVGKMGELAARHLNALGVSRLYVANRTLETAEQLVGMLGGQAVPFTRLYEVLPEVDLVFCCTGAPHHVLGVAELESIDRGDRPMLIIDLSVPRNVAPEVGDLPAIRLYDIDGLESIARRNREERASAALEVAGIVEEEIRGFQAWVKNFQMGSTIASLRDKVQALRELELERFWSKHSANFRPEQRDLLEALSQALANKFLHGPMAQLKDMSGLQQQQLAHALRLLFGLEVEDSSERYQRRLRERRDTLPSL